jgi:hypothetical protein
MKDSKEENITRKNGFFLPLKTNLGIPLSW